MDEDLQPFRKQMMSIFYSIIIYQSIWTETLRNVDRVIHFHLIDFALSIPNTWTLFYPLLDLKLRSSFQLLRFQFMELIF